RWPSAGIATARAADTKWRLSHLLDHRSAPPTVAVSCQMAPKNPVDELPVSPAPHDHRAAPAATALNPHSARGTTCDHLPRLRALALLGRRHTRARIDPSLRRPRNLHKTRLSHCEKKGATIQSPRRRGPVGSAILRNPGGG